MAEKRMFAKTIVLSDAFLDMPMSARCLYFTLNMFADDDGFVGSPKGIMRQCGASQDDMQILIAKKFVLDFDSGVIVIKHWRINNYLRGDRHKDTTYQDEMNQISVDEKGAYTRVGIPSDNQVTTNCQPLGIPSIDKNSIDKNSIGDGGDIPQPTDMQEIVSTWNEIPHTLNVKDVVPTTARWNELQLCLNMYGKDKILEAIQHVRDSAYLKRNGRVAFDHYINRNAIQKLLEGNYDHDFKAKPSADSFEEQLEEWVNGQD